MKKILFVLVHLIIGSSVQIYANTFYYYVINKTKKEVAVRDNGRNDPFVETIVIPETVEIEGETYAVTRAGGFSNTNCSNIILPNTIKEISTHAFYGNNNIRSITIGKGILKIGKGAFESCNLLDDITFLSELPPHIEGFLNEDWRYNIYVDKKSIMDYACTYYISDANHKGKKNRLLSFTSDRELQTLFDENYEYLVCEETKECIITKKLNPNAAAEDLIIPDKATFYFGLASEDYKVVGIGPNVFSKPIYENHYDINTDITGTVTLGKNIRIIGKGSFAGTNISHINFNDNIKAIEHYAFSNCRMITELKFPPSIVRMGDYAFDCNAYVTELTLPNNLKIIGEYAFYQNFYHRLQSIEFNDELLYIGAHAFEGNNELNTAIFHDKLIEIGDRAFANCMALSNVKFGKNLNRIGAQAFFNAQLQEIHIPSAVETIDNYAFRNCELKQVYFEESIIPIKTGDDAIEYDNIEYIFIGRDFSFQSPAFKKLKEIDFGNLVSKIPASTFKNCLMLTSVSFGSGLTEIGDESFKYCSISDIIIPSKVQKIGSGAFAGNRLYSLTIGSGITEIGDNAFEGNTTLAIVNLTAKTPPSANGNIFTNYDVRLYTDPRYSDSYKDPNLCWSLFKQYELKNVDNISLNTDRVPYLPNEQFQLQAFVLPEDATLQTVLWESSNPNIATVNTSGLVSIVDNPKNNSLINDATCKIRAYTLYADGPIAECTFTDYTDYTLVSSIILNTDKVEGKEGDQIQISATVLPENATNKVLTWSSSDESVALVDDTGLISLVKKGTTVITASATDNSGVSADCAIIVTEASGIEDILTDKSSYVKIFNLKGIFIFEGKYADARLTPDYYIVVCDGKNIKVKVQ